MKRVELYGRVRHAVMIEGLSQREAARCFGIDPRTVRKMLSYSVPPGYVRTRPPVRPKLDPFIGIIDRILEEDKDRPKKQPCLSGCNPHPLYVECAVKRHASGTLDVVGVGDNRIGKEATSHIEADIRAAA